MDFNFNEEEEALISQFVAITLSSDDNAVFFLGATNWELNDALSNFYEQEEEEEQQQQQQQQPEAEINIPDPAAPAADSLAQEQQVERKVKADQKETKDVEEEDVEAEEQEISSIASFASDSNSTKNMPTNTVSEATQEEIPNKPETDEERN